MKTVKEIGLDLNVSTVTVYNHINKLDKELVGNIFKKKGVTYLDDEGIRQIKISMGLIQVPVVKENISMGEIVQDITEQITINLKEDITDLKKQVEELTEQNKVLLELKDQNEEILELMREKKNKKSFFNFFK